jgi:hypothetical protein
VYFLRAESDCLKEVLRVFHQDGFRLSKEVLRGLPQVSVRVLKRLVVYFLRAESDCPKDVLHIAVRSFQVNAGILSQMESRSFRSATFSFHYSLVI